MIYGLFMLCLLTVTGGPGRTGRPSKLTDEVQAGIAEAVKLGAPLDMAAAAQGIHRSTLFEWLKRGRAARDRVEAGESVGAEDLRYLALVEELDAARADAEIEALRIIDRAMHHAKDGWKAATWRLAHSSPDRWARPSHNQPPPKWLDD